MFPLILLFITSPNHEKHVHALEFFGDFHSLIRYFEMLDNKGSMTMLAEHSSTKKHWFIRDLGSSKFISSPNAVVDREPLVAVFVRL